MTQYTNPNLTQREIVEQSKAAILTMMDALDTTAAEAEAHTDDTLDYVTAQMIAQHVSLLMGSKLQLEMELTRLNNIIAAWDAE
ncbi:hypothetical protein KRZ98_18335 [Sphingobium sp. AS12]|uniref:hypothetical protein n=1 Tax=Sphingobium sp. AS12 TaxID=2849495 RepID=UPI001C312610|nr:hypothetical protein [Sphingobium sp. AS12]MBV2150197.1 hypothetical protein [Sphingobium sp. AS12]